MKKDPSPDEPSLVASEVATDPVGPRHLTESQAKALIHLSYLCSLAGHRESYGGFVPRAKPLLLGPSGSGKTALVTRLCDTEKLPFLSINAGSWVVISARAEPYTLTVIQKFVRKYPRGVLLLDEVDKAVPSGSEAWSHAWNLSVTTEILSLLDGQDGDQRLLTSGWSKADVDRLRNFFIVGAGAWQRQAVKAETEHSSHVEQVLQDFAIPLELAYRFNAKPVILELPTRKDFAKAIERVHADVGIKKVSKDCLDNLVDAAVKARCGLRWVEQYVSELLAAHPELRRKSSETTPATGPEKTFVSQAALQSAVENFHRLLEAAEPAMSHLQSQVRLVAKRLWETSTEPVLDLDQDRVDVEKFDNLCQEILTGLQRRYSIDDEERKLRESEIWIKGHKMVSILDSMLKENAAPLSSLQLLPLFTNSKMRLSRILAAQRYLGSLEVNE